MSNLREPLDSANTQIVPQSRDALQWQTGSAGTVSVRPLDRRPNSPSTITAAISHCGWGRILDASSESRGSAT